MSSVHILLFAFSKEKKQKRVSIYIRNRHVHKITIKLILCDIHSVRKNRGALSVNKKIYIESYFV